MSECDEIQLLSQLGLTSRQAKVFVTLTKVKEESIQNIAANTKMDRANVYRTISELEKLGLVEKILAVPALYKAISMQDIMSTLLENKQKEYLDIKERTKEVLKKHNENKETKIKNESQLTIIPKGKPTERKIRELFDYTRTSYDYIFSLNESKFDITKVSPHWKKLIAKGVKIRLIIHQNGTTSGLKSICDIKDNLFKIKYTSTSPPASVALFDRKEALILMSTTEIEKSPALLTDDKGLVAMAKEYFEQIWNRTT